MTAKIALFSGGMDSAVATHISMRFGPCDRIIYLDTRTGLDRNRRFVERFADRYGWPVWTLRTSESYEELVHDNGFPGPSRHFIMYQRLKDRALCEFTATVDDDVEFWTGIRAQESARRMKHVQPETERSGGRWTWKAPIAGWDKREVTRYADRFILPRNSLWRTLGRSGDCYCGAYGNREELLDLRACGEGGHADWIESLEESVPFDGEKGKWAWSSMSDAERRAARAEGDDAQADLGLCATCGPREYPTPDGGEADDDARE